MPGVSVDTITLFYCYCRFMCVHLLWLYTPTTESSACSKNPKVHISSHDYDELFVGVGSETFLVDRLQCVMTCLKRRDGTKMAAYQDSVQLCCCVDRDVESVQENEQTVEVYLVDFCRGELQTNAILVTKLT